MPALRCRVSKHSYIPILAWGETGLLSRGGSLLWPSMTFTFGAGLRDASLHPFADHVALKPCKD
jgi:hypothetical protein